MDTVPRGPCCAVIAAKSPFSRLRRLAHNERWLDRLTEYLVPGGFDNQKYLKGGFNGSRKRSQIRSDSLARVSRIGLHRAGSKYSRPGPRWKVRHLDKNRQPECRPWRRDCHT